MVYCRSLLAVLAAVAPPILAIAHPKASLRPVPYSENVDFSHLGCFEQTEPDASATELRIKNRDNGIKAWVTTAEQCLSICATKGNQYVMVGNGHECYCVSGAELKNAIRVDDSKCDTPCDGDSSQACGATDRFNWYKSTEIQKRHTSTKTSSSSKAPTCSSKTVTSTSTKTSWQTTVSTQKSTVTVHPTKTTTKTITINSVSTVTGHPTKTSTVTSGSTKTLTTTKVLSNSCSKTITTASSSRGTCSNPTVTVTLSGSGTCSQSTITHTDSTTSTLTSTVTEASLITETSTLTETATLTETSTLTETLSISVCPPPSGCTNTPNLLDGGFEINYDSGGATPAWQPHYNGFVIGRFIGMGDITAHSGQQMFGYVPRTSDPASRPIQQNIAVCVGSIYRASAYVATPSYSSGTACSFRICLDQICGVTIFPTTGAWQLYTASFIPISESVNVILEYICTPGTGAIAIDDVAFAAI